MTGGSPGIGGISGIPANEASWEDLQTAVGTRSDPSRCSCQQHKSRGTEWDADAVPVEERARRTRARTGCGHPEAHTTSGLAAYLDGEAVGWRAVEPRTAYVGPDRAPLGGPCGGQGRRRHLGCDLLRHAHGLPPTQTRRNASPTAVSSGPASP